MVKSIRTIVCDSDQTKIYYEKIEDDTYILCDKYNFPIYKTKNLSYRIISITQSYILVGNKNEFVVISSYKNNEKVYKYYKIYEDACNENTIVFTSEKNSPQHSKEFKGYTIHILNVNNHKTTTIEDVIFIIRIEGDYRNKRKFYIIKHTSGNYSIYNSIDQTLKTILSSDLTLLPLSLQLQNNNMVMFEHKNKNSEYNYILYNVVTDQKYEYVKNVVNKHNKHTNSWIILEIANPEYEKDLNLIIFANGEQEFIKDNWKIIKDQDKNDEYIIYQLSDIHLNTNNDVYKKFGIGLDMEERKNTYFVYNLKKNKLMSSFQKSENFTINKCCNTLDCGYNCMSIETQINDY